MSISRVFGLIFAVACMTLLAPVALLIAMGVRLNSSGEVLVRSTKRRGDGTGFSFVRFRTNGPDSSRATEFDRFVRRYGLDRVPAIVSLLNGEITLRDLWDITREPGA
jgi:putative colanic acid biosysnthesis UDP-glucose lipid carrier transferase